MLENLERHVGGYFTQFRTIRNHSLKELESILGFRGGRLTTKGALIYRLLKLPSIGDFEFCGMIPTKDQWDQDYAPKRNAELAGSRLYHERTRVPDSDETFKRLAMSSWTLEGGNMLVKIWPLVRLPVDDTPAGYRPSPGIFQWRFKDGRIAPARLLVALGPNDKAPVYPPLQTP